MALGNWALKVGRWAAGPLGVGCAVLLVGAAFAQPRQTFKTATRLVEVSVVVTDRSGRPVEGLTQADFTISDEREPQKISFFEVRDDRASTGASRPGIFHADGGPNTFTNAVAGGSGTTTVLLLDGANAGFATVRWAQQHIDRYLQRMRPGDRIALYAFDSGVRVLHDFSTDAASLRRALDIFQARTTGHYDASQEAPTDTGAMAVWLVDPGNAAAEFFGERRAVDTFERLETIAAHLAGISGRKNLVWVSEAFAIPTGLGRMEVLHRMHRATEALSNAQTAVYPVDARGLVGSHTTSMSGRTSFHTMASIHPNIETMQVVADDTGGRAYAHTNALDTSIAKAVDDGRLTYVLGYYPFSTTLDGSFRQVDVKVRRPGVQVRHRAGYMAAPPPATDVPGRDAAIRKALEAPLQATGISLAAEVTHLGTIETVDVAIRIDLGGLTLERDGSTWRGAADVLIAQVQRTGKGEVTDARPIAIVLTESGHKRALVEGLTDYRRIHLDPGVHEVRIVVRDVATGNVGSLVIPKRGLVRQ